MNSVNILVALFLLVSGNNCRSSPPVFLLPFNSSLSSLSVCQRGTGTFHLQSGGFAIGVNGLGRMERRVPLSQTAICFMGDQCGPVGDDGLMSRHKTITVTGERCHATVSLLP